MYAVNPGTSTRYGRQHAFSSHRNFDYQLMTCILTLI